MQCFVDCEIGEAEGALVVSKGVPVLRLLLSNESESISEEFPTACCLTEENCILSLLASIVFLLRS